MTTRRELLRGPRERARGFTVFTGDWLDSSTVRDMTFEEEGLYWRLLVASWQHVGLPVDQCDIERLVEKKIPDDCLWILEDLFPVHSKPLSKMVADDLATLGGKRRFCPRGSMERQRAKSRGGYVSADSKDTSQDTSQVSSQDSSQLSSVIGIGKEEEIKKGNGKVRKRKAPTGPHQEVVDHWVKGWEEHRLGAKWKLAPKDLAALKKLRTLADGDVEEVKTRMNRMMADEDAWVAANASPSLLVSKWNNYAVVIKKRTRPQTALDRALLEIENGTP